MELSEVSEMHVQKDASLKHDGKSWSQIQIRKTAGTAEDPARPQNFNDRCIKGFN